MKLKIVTTAIALSASLIVSGCGGGSSSKGSNDVDENTTVDLVISTFIDDNEAFISMVDGSKSSMDISNSTDISPWKGLFTYGKFVYDTGHMADNKISKYSVLSDNTLHLEKEIIVKESGLAIPSTFIFVDDSKAYVTLAGVGELLDINLENFTIRDRIDLSPYAMDENTTLYKDGGNDANPEASAGVIRDGKLYLGLGQVNKLAQGTGSFICRGLASLLIIDIASNTIEKHITDDRTCTSGSINAGSELTLVENGDIYVNNTASFGFDSRGIKPGYLRIKAGEEQFDPDYFFNVRDLDLSADFPELNDSLARTTHVYKEKYHNGKLYVTLPILGLIDPNDPNNYVANRTYQPYTFDLVNQSITKLDMLPSNGWSAQIAEYKDEIIFPQSTVDGNGLYRVGEKTPFLTTVGLPLHVLEYKK